MYVFLRRIPIANRPFFYAIGEFGEIDMLFCGYLCVKNPLMCVWHDYIIGRRLRYPFRLFVSFRALMMTSSNGNIFHVAGHLCGEFTGHRWIPRKGQWRGTLMFSFICARINDWVNNREDCDLRRHRAHYDVQWEIIGMSKWRLSADMMGFFLACPFNHILPWRWAIIKAPVPDEQFRRIWVNLMTNNTPNYWHRYKIQPGTILKIFCSLCFR